MTRENRLRRVLILCVCFSRNLAYHEAGNSWRRSDRISDFWISVDSNFLDIAVLEWCKLFCDKRGNHYWRKIVYYGKHSRFEEELHCKLNMTSNNFDNYIKEIRSYRDRFLAHLDDDERMDIPRLESACKAVEFYHAHIIQHEANGFNISPWALDLPTYFDCCLAEAKAIYDKCVPNL